MQLIFQLLAHRAVLAPANLNGVLPDRKAASSLSPLCRQGFLHYSGCVTNRAAILLKLAQQVIQYVMSTHPSRHLQPVHYCTFLVAIALTQDACCHRANCGSSAARGSQSSSRYALQRYAWFEHPWRLTSSTLLFGNLLQSRPPVKVWDAKHPTCAM